MRSAATPHPPRIMKGCGGLKWAPSTRRNLRKKGDLEAEVTKKPPKSLTGTGTFTAEEQRVVDSLVDASTLQDKLTARILAEQVVMMQINAGRIHRKAKPRADELRALPAYNSNTKRTLDALGVTTKRPEDDAGDAL